MKRHLFLVGFMGAGKTSVARLVARELDRDFLDVDAMIEREQDTTIPVIFAERGEERFRALESAMLASLQDREPAVVACGGGIVLRPENRALLGKTGTVVYLKVTGAEALARIGDMASRPLLAGSGGQLAATQLLKAREVLYESVADATVDTVGRTPDEVAREVIEAVGAVEGQ